MTFHIVIGYIGCGFLFMSFIPQTYKLIKTPEDSKHISKVFIFLILSASLCMGIYAFYISAYPVLIANSSVFLNNIIILCLYIFKKNKPIIEEENNGILV